MVCINYQESAYMLNVVLNATQCVCVWMHSPPNESQMMLEFAAYDQLIDYCTSTSRGDKGGRRRCACWCNP